MNAPVLLFSGQGAQKVGMGKDWFDHSATAKSMVQEADSLLGYSLSKTMFEGPENELTATSRCQPALYLHGLMGLTLLKEAVPNLKPSAAAGLSLGEFTAHAAATTFTFEDGLRLVSQRGTFMEEACNATDGAMAALIGGEIKDIESLAARCDVDVANFNSPGQIVISGPSSAIDQAVSLAKEHGIRRAIKLKVAGAYHSRLMADAQEKLAIELANTTMTVPAIGGTTVPVIANYTAKPVTTEGAIRSTLTSQVTGSVRWTETIKYLISSGHSDFIEIGPGKVLAGLVGKIAPEANVLSIEDQVSLDAAIAALS